MYATIFTLALAAAPAAAEPTTLDRHGAARRAEAHAALVVQHAHARQAAGALYQFSASRVVADRQLAQRMAVDISGSLDAGEREIARIVEGLSPTDREAVSLRLRELQDRHAQAVNHTRELKNELAAAGIDGRQVRFLAGEIYQAVSLAEDSHDALMHHLGVKVADAAAPPAR